MKERRKEIVIESVYSFCKNEKKKGATKRVSRIGEEEEM